MHHLENLFLRFSEYLQASKAEVPMESCVFCQIIRKELPGSFVYEDELCAAFMDIHPANEGHVLVIPKQHKARFTPILMKIRDSI